MSMEASWLPGSEHFRATAHHWGSRTQVSGHSVDSDTNDERDHALHVRLTRNRMKERDIL